MRLHRLFAGNPAISMSLSDLKTGGFASPPYGGFALSERGQLIVKRTRWQHVPSAGRRVAATAHRRQRHIAVRVTNETKGEQRDIGSRIQRTTLSTRTFCERCSRN